MLNHCIRERNHGILETIFSPWRTKRDAHSIDMKNCMINETNVFGNSKRLVRTHGIRDRGADDPFIWTKTPVSSSKIHTWKALQPVFSLWPEHNRRQVVANAVVYRCPNYPTNKRRGNSHELWQEIRPQAIRLSRWLGHWHESNQSIWNEWKNRWLAETNFHEKYGRWWAKTELKMDISALWSRSWRLSTHIADWKKKWTKKLSGVSRGFYTCHGNKSRFC